jgi:hypothetical protein
MQPYITQQVNRLYPLRPFWGRSAIGYKPIKSLQPWVVINIEKISLPVFIFIALYICGTTCAMLWETSFQLVSSSCVET